jgi:hypothetical protein
MKAWTIAVLGIGGALVACTGPRTLPVPGDTTTSTVNGYPVGAGTSTYGPEPGGGYVPEGSGTESTR